MKIFLQRGNNAAFNDNKGNQQSARLLFFSSAALISVTLTLFGSGENTEIYLKQLKKRGILDLI